MNDTLSNSQSADAGDPDFIVESDVGRIVIRSKCDPLFFQDLKMDDGLGTFSHYSSIVKKMDSFEKYALRDDSRVSVAIRDPNMVVGYCIGSYPEPSDRWILLGKLMYELAALEISRNFRGLNLAHLLIQQTMNDDFFEDKITYMCGYSWHWDLEGKNLTAGQYRNMMKQLYGRFGFREVYTNEPNIALRPENIMMIRVGSRVSAEDHMKFRHLRFGIKPK